MNRYLDKKRCVEAWEHYDTYWKKITQQVIDGYRNEIEEYELQQTTHIYGDATPRKGYAERAHTI